MAKRRFTSREFNREPDRIKQAAKDDPGIITKRGEPTLTVMSWADHCGLKRPSPSLLGRLSVRGLSAIALETARSSQQPISAFWNVTCLTLPTSRTRFRAAHSINSRHR